MRELVTHTNFTALRVTEAGFWSASSMLEEVVMSWNAGLANSLKYLKVGLSDITTFKVIQGHEF